ncbi:hypothetical protein GCM10025772_17880 [Ferrimonas gelatinilytica]|uniref:Uncharacterized protein n=2 Tax=Ferrimonas gelatinilytica TaxID=1255257 RepID=A0ABP9S7B0_9GAMM
MGRGESRDAYVGTSIALTELAMDRRMEVHQLIQLYDDISDSQEEGKRSVITLLTLMHRDDTRLKDLFDTEYGSDNVVLEMNWLIEDFLEKNGFQECEGLSSERLISCHQNIIWDK